VTNCLGEAGAAAQNALTVAKIVALGALIARIRAVELGGAPSQSRTRQRRDSIVSGFAAAFVAVLFTIGGWQQLNMVAGDPASGVDHPRALTLGILIVIAIYSARTRCTCTSSVAMARRQRGRRRRHSGRLVGPVGAH
jgi:amino acid transporter